MIETIKIELNGSDYIEFLYENGNKIVKNILELQEILLNTQLSFINYVDKEETLEYNFFNAKVNKNLYLIISKACLLQYKSLIDTLNTIVYVANKPKGILKVYLTSKKILKLKNNKNLKLAFLTLAQEKLAMLKKNII